MADDPAWHEALALAITGQRLPGLGRQPQPDLTALASVIGERTDLAQLWGSPHPVPAELMRGIGPAQFAAAVAQLQRRLGPGPASAPVVADRVLTADERRLLADVPPHHGS